MPLLEGNPVREERRVRELLPPTPMAVPAPSDAEALRLPPSLVQDEVERRQQPPGPNDSTARYLRDGPSSVVDIALYEESVRLQSLIDDPQTLSAALWGMQYVGTLARVQPTYREAARALHAAVQS